MQRATLKEVARLAGVHPGTASRALNEGTQSLVAPETAERVRAVARELGYTPNPIARSLKTSRSASVGLVLPDLTNPIFPPIARGVEDVLRAAGYSTWIINTDNVAEREASAVASFRQRSVEGFVFASARLKDPLIERMVAEQTPLVLVNRRINSAGASSVSADDSIGISLAVEHLVDLGHREIVHLAGPQTLSTGLSRRLAFKQSADQLGLDGDRVVVCDAYSEEAGARAMSALLTDGERFSAVIAGNDLIALGCYDALRAHGLKCPRDISVVGYNDMPFMSQVDPPLTSVRIPQYDLGAEAARMLLEMLAAPAWHPRSLLLPPKLITRLSTGPRRKQR